MAGGEAEAGARAGQAARGAGEEEAVVGAEDGGGGGGDRGGGGHGRVVLGIRATVGRTKAVERGRRLVWMRGGR